MERLRYKVPAVRQCPPDIASRLTYEVSTIWLPKQDGHKGNTIDIPMWTWEIPRSFTSR